MQLQNLHLFPINVSRLGRTGHLEAVGTSISRKRSEQGNLTREPENYIIECAAFHGDILKIKIPLSPLDDFQKLVKIIRTGKTAVVSFTGLIIKPYAMTTATGTFLSGVSGRADSFQIVEVIDDEIEDIPIEE